MMKFKKYANYLIVFNILLVIGLVGCGKTSQNETIIEPKQIIELDDANESSTTESNEDEPELSLEDSALLAYQDILNAAPAIVGEHEQLFDASFGYEENQELFGDHYELYAYYDLNQDDIPELITMSTVNMRWTPISVYTYSDGEAVLIENPYEMVPYCTFEQNSSANGAYITYFCEDNHIHSVWRGETPIGEQEDNYAYKLEGTSLIQVDCSLGDNDNIVLFNDIAEANIG